MSKFKVGDKVRIKEDLVVDKLYSGFNFTKGMDEYKGKEATIILIGLNYFNTPYYGLDIGNKEWSWTDDMLEPVETKTTPIYVKCIDNSTFEDVLKVGKIYKAIDVVNFKENDDRCILEGDNLKDFRFLVSRFKIISNPQSNQPSKSIKSTIKIRKVGDTTYATYNKIHKGKATRNKNVDDNDDRIGILISVARALQINESKVKEIIDVLFDEDKKETNFKVGDRVVGIGSFLDCNIEGVKGTVKILYDIGFIGVEFDKNIFGHDLDGICKYGYGLYVKKERIKLITVSKDEEIIQLQNKLDQLQSKIKLLLD